MGEWVHVGGQMGEGEGELRGQGQGKCVWKIGLEWELKREKKAIIV